MMVEGNSGVAGDEDADAEGETVGEDNAEGETVGSGDEVAEAVGVALWVEGDGVSVGWGLAVLTGTARLWKLGFPCCCS
jgi:hypothetical protein